MTEVREPVWTYLRQHCNSFATLSADAVLSDIFTVNTVGMMTQELKSLFLLQKSNQSVFHLVTMQFQTKQVHLLLHNFPKFASEQI